MTKLKLTHKKRNYAAEYERRKEYERERRNSPERKEYMREYRKRDYYIEYERKRSINPERIKYKREYSQRLEVKLIKKEWRKNNNDKCREYARRWRMNNPEKVKENNRLRRKVKRKKFWMLWFGFDESGKCYCCSDKITFDNFHKGHVISLKTLKDNNWLHLDDNFHNFRPLCPDCNLAMNDRYLYDWSHETGNNKFFKPKLCLG